MPKTPPPPPPPKREPFKGVIKDGTRIELPIPALSATIAEMYVKCPRQFWFRHVRGMILPPAIVMVAGTSGHKALEINNRHKMKTGTDLPVKEVVSAFRDDWATRRREVPKPAWAQEGTTPDHVAAEVTAPLTDYMKSTAASIRPTGAEEKCRHRLRRRAGDRPDRPADGGRTGPRLQGVRQDVALPQALLRPAEPSVGRLRGGHEVGARGLHRARQGRPGRPRARDDAQVPPGRGAARSRPDRQGDQRGRFQTKAP